MKRWSWRAWVGVLLAGSGALAGRAAPTASEVQVKAAYIFHFVQFVDWPPASFPRPTDPIVIGIFGHPAVGDALLEMVQGETFGARPLLVRRVRSAEEAAACQILYVAAGDEDDFRLGRLRQAPVLTVGESDDFLRDGGIIAFFTDHHHVRLRINLDAAHQASLQVSAKLLRVAQVLSP